MRNWNGLFKKGNQKDNRTHLYDKIYENSVRAVLPGKSRKIYKKGYTLAINSSWQGKFDEYIEVIGDKCAGGITQEYFSNKTEFLAHFQELKEIVSIPIKVLHVMRNPYDIITTNALHEMGRRVTGVGKAAAFVHNVKQNASVAKVGHVAFIRKNVIDFFNEAQTVMKLTELVGQSNMLNIDHKDLVHHPRQTIMSITNWGRCQREIFTNMCR